MKIPLSVGIPTLVHNFEKLISFTRFNPMIVIWYWLLLPALCLECFLTFQNDYSRS